MQASRGCGVRSGQRATRGVFFEIRGVMVLLQKKGKVSKDARAAASRPSLMIRTPVSVTIRIVGAGDFSLLADDDFHADNTKLRRARAMVDVAAPESLTCLSSKPPRSTGCFCEKVGIGGRRMMRGSRPSRILTATRASLWRSTQVPQTPGGRRNAGATLLSYRCLAKLLLVVLLQYAFVLSYWWQQLFTPRVALRSFLGGF